MEKNFNLDIISPESILISEKVDSVTIPSFEGEMTILADHISTITFLRPGVININENKKKYFVEEGTVEFSNNNLLILTSTARDLANFDKSSINELLQKAAANLNTQSVSYTHLTLQTTPYV